LSVLIRVILGESLSIVDARIPDLLRGKMQNFALVSALRAVVVQIGEAAGLRS